MVDDATEPELPGDGEAAVADEPAAVADEPAAVADEPAAVADEPAAVADEPAAVADEPAAVADEPAAVADEPAAVADEPAAVADEPAAVAEDTAQAPPSPSLPPARSVRPALPVSRRTIGIALALVAIVGVLVIDLVSILGEAKKGGALGAASGAPSAAALSSATVTARPAAMTAPVFPTNPEPPVVEAPPEAPHEHHTTRAVIGSVLQAAARSCTTASVDGLSRQIIRQARCIDPNAFVAVPHRPNLSRRSNVFLYMEAPARDHLLKALDANKHLTMTVNSSLRTVAQQYLLWRWYAGKRCGIHLATRPGDSNHETGLALDIAEAPAWRKPLEQHDFHWLGAIDNMHFDYKGPGAASHSSVDVKAFQQLWNRNHPDDHIAESGRYTPETEERLKKSPAAGFPHGPHCGR